MTLDPGHPETNPQHYSISVEKESVKASRKFPPLTSVIIHLILVFGGVNIVLCSFFSDGFLPTWLLNICFKMVALVQILDSDSERQTSNPNLHRLRFSHFQTPLALLEISVSGVIWHDVTWHLYLASYPLLMKCCDVILHLHLANYLCKVTWHDTVQGDTVWPNTSHEAGWRYVMSQLV